MCVYICLMCSWIHFSRNFIECFRITLHKGYWSEVLFLCWFLCRRWVRLLFGREFPLQDLLVVWDALFADGLHLSLVDYVFTAMLLYIRDALISSNYQTCLGLLMHYPLIGDIHSLILKALFLRDPKRNPWHFSDSHTWAPVQDLSPRAWGGVAVLGLNLAVPSGSLKPEPLAWQQGELASVWLFSL